MPLILGIKAEEQSVLAVLIIDCERNIASLHPIGRSRKNTGGIVTIISFKANYGAKSQGMLVVQNVGCVDLSALGVEQVVNRSSSARRKSDHLQSLA